MSKELKELARDEETVVSDFKTYDIPKTIVGSVVGFFVWKYLSKEYPMTTPETVDITKVSAKPTVVEDMQINDAARRKTDLIVGW